MKKYPGERIAFGLAFFVAVFLVVEAFYLQGRLPSVVPLFYSLPKGEEQLVPSYFLNLLAMGTLIVFGMNLFLADKASAVDHFMGRLFIWASTLLVAMVAITLIKIWLIFLW